MQTWAVQACVILERLSDPLHNKSSQPTALQHCGLCCLPSLLSLPSSFPPPVFFAPKAKHLFLADGKLKLHWLNKYILASNNRFWKERLEGGREQRGGWGGEYGPKKKKSPQAMFGKRAMEHPLVWWWLLGCLSSSHTHTHTHTQPTFPVGCCC